jgi:hypothetical protein
MQYELGFFFFYRNMSYSYETVQNWAPFPASVSSVKWLKFHHRHGDRIRTSLRTTNNALNAIINTTNSFIVDVTPPYLHHLRDGLQPRDQEYQVRELVLRT